MATEIEFVIVCVEVYRDHAIDTIRNQTGLEFPGMINPEDLDEHAVLGTKVSCIQVFGDCVRGNSSATETVINAFKNAPFKFPEIATLTIYADDGSVESVTRRE